MTGEWVGGTSSSYPVVNPGSGAYFDGTYNGGNNGGDDLFVLKFISDNCICSLCPSTTDTINTDICQGDSIFVGNGWQTTSGTYYDTLVNICGSDSIIITILTVHPLPSVTATSNSPLCEGGTLNLSCMPGGMSSYAWSGPGGFLSTHRIRR